MTRILAFAGSTRKASLNKKLIQASASIVEAVGGEITVIDLIDYPAPLYQGDEEQANGHPPAMMRLRNEIAAHDALLISTPEYNANLTPLIVNTFSWLSRPVDGEVNGVLKGKPVGLMATSPGALGGIRVLPRLRAYLADLSCVVAPGVVSVPRGGAVFGEDGTLSNESTRGRVEELARKLVAMGDLQARLGG